MILDANKKSFFVENGFIRTAYLCKSFMHLNYIYLYCITIFFDAKVSIDSTFMLTLVLNHFSLSIQVLFGIILQGYLDLP